MVGADTWSFEVIPFEKDAGVFEVHQILIPLNGIHILENINTEEMVKRPGLGVPLHPRPRPHHWRRASDRKSNRDQVTEFFSVQLSVSSVSLW